MTIDGAMAFSATPRGPAQNFSPPPKTPNNSVAGGLRRVVLGGFTPPGPWILSDARAEPLVMRLERPCIWSVAVSPAWGLRFRDWGLGIKASGVEFKEGLGFGVCGLGLGFRGLEVWRLLFRCVLFYVRILWIICDPDS